MSLSWLEISKKALLNNISQIKKVSKNSPKFIAVVKANAYGHGLFEVVNAIKDQVDYLAVDAFSDAVLLRKKKISTPILVIGRTLPDQVEIAIKNKIEISISTFDVLQTLKKTKGKLVAHLCVDTGLGRDGFTFDDAKKLLPLLKNKNLELRGLFAHLAASDDEDFDSYTQNQIQKLLEWKKMLNAIGLDPMVHHTASAGSMNPNFTKYFDAIRVGYSIYGLWPSEKMHRLHQNKINLTPVLSWKTLISEVKSLPKGSAISYGCTHILKRDSKIAVLPIGYFDGIFRCSSNKGFFLVKGQKVPQLGRVMMNIVVLDVTDVKNVKEGDVVTVIGNDKKEQISVDDWAELAQTSGYEIVTRINSGLERRLV